MKKIINIVVLFLAFGITSCGHKPDQSKDSLLVYVGASLTDVMTELRDSFEVKYEVKVHLNTASSGTLARQIEHGGDAGVYISASRRWAAYVDSLGYVVKDSLQAIAYNALVLIAPDDSKLMPLEIDSTLDLETMLGSNYFALGNPAHVPAGKYAKQALMYYHQYNALGAQLLLTKDIRSALMTVEMGEAAMGIVYATDAQKSKKVKVLGSFPATSHKVISYVACLLKEGKHEKAFYKYINAEETRWIWEKHGFKK